MSSHRTPIKRERDSPPDDVDRHRHRTPIKRERDSPPADDDDDRHRHRDRSRSPRDKVVKSEDKDNLKREKEEKLVFVRKRIKDHEREREFKRPTPDWVTDLAGAVLCTERRRKYKYNLDKRGGSRSGFGPRRDRDWGNDGEYDTKKYPMISDGYGNCHQIVPDGNGGYKKVVSDASGDAWERKVEAKAEELMKVPHHILEAMAREEEARKNYMRSYEKYPNYDRDAETVYERYMRTTGKRENP
ncbi:hypothetical protein QBC32DRAFT_220258 [Pseudoneurospora amorphoporcata]|uniref:Uncharacterized protein n=1 Tax=Pseudoneurospora amorphoporcata TaxID=241081 RepID=A0AAN6NQC9_9PEZI|nr:hypothetical protein QBC32DRAFT_220258 [Pseudoneurospora amorphoporcata]